MALIKVGGQSGREIAAAQPGAGRLVAKVETVTLRSGRGWEAWSVVDTVTGGRQDVDDQEAAERLAARLTARGCMITSGNAIVEIGRR